MQGAETEASLRGVEQQPCSRSSSLRRRSQPPRTPKAPQRNRWSVLQHVTRRYRSNCSCLCRRLNPPRAAERARICLSGATSRRAHLCLISRPHIQQRNSKNSGKTAPTFNPHPAERTAPPLSCKQARSRFPLHVLCFGLCFGRRCSCSGA